MFHRQDQQKAKERVVNPLRDRARTSERVSLEWINIRYSFVQKQKDGKVLERVLLQGLSGSASCGQLIAIIGPSGSGKTSLLNVLAGRTPYASAAQLSGEILVNGAPRVLDQFRNLSAYLIQDDILFARLTVWETLWLAANFYLPASATDEDKESIVQSVLQELGLGHVSNTRIGSATLRGVSGGERKRVGIAVELISNPSVLFMDEPTSGLDAFQAESVMNAMNTLTGNGRLVIAAIHQPRSSIFGMFDRLMILSEGKTMFYGPADEAVQFFEEIGFMCPDQYNPADYFLDTVSMDYRTAESERETRERIEYTAQQWKFRVKHDAGVLLSSERVVVAPMTRAERIQERFSFKSSWANNFSMLSWRAWNEFRRNVPTLLIKYGTTIFFAIIVGLIFRDLGLNQKGVQNRLGLLFFIVLNQTFTNMFGVITVFQHERKIIDRERASKAYRMNAYYTAKFISDLFYNLSAPIIFGTIVYWMTGLRPTAEAFFIFLVVIILQVLAATGLGMAVSAGTPNAQIAQSIISPIAIILVLYGGFYIQEDSLPVGSQWVTWISFIRWSFQTLAVNEFRDRNVDMGPGVTGNDVLRSIGYENVEIWQGIVALIVLAVIFHFAAFAVLVFVGERYLKIGHKGRKYQKLERALPQEEQKSVRDGQGSAPAA